MRKIGTLLLPIAAAGFVLLLPADGRTWTWGQCMGQDCKWSGMPQDFYADSNTVNTAQYLLSASSGYAWENAVDTNYDLRNFAYRNSSGSALDYKNTIHNYDIESDCGGCVAWTLRWVLSGTPSTVRDVDIEMDTQDSWYVGTGTCPSNKLDYWSTLLHEYGHMALCGHSTHATAIMKPGIANGVMRRTFTSDDDSCLIYGQLIGAYGN